MGCRAEDSRPQLPGALAGTRWFREAQRRELTNSVLISRPGLDSGFTLCLLAHVLISRVSVLEQMVPVHSVAQTRQYDIMALVPVGFRISRDFMRLWGCGPQRFSFIYPVFPKPVHT